MLGVVSVWVSINSFTGRGVHSSVDRKWLSYGNKSSRHLYWPTATTSPRGFKYTDTHIKSTLTNCERWVKVVHTYIFIIYRHIPTNKRSRANVLPFKHHRSSSQSGHQRQRLTYMKTTVVPQNYIIVNKIPEFELKMK